MHFSRKTLNAGSGFFYYAIILDYITMEDIYNIFEDIDFTEPVQPNDCSVTDRELLAGRVAPTTQGHYDDPNITVVNPLFNRGVDFTDVGNVLHDVDNQHLAANAMIEAQRAALEPKEVVSSPQ